MPTQPMATILKNLSANLRGLGLASDVRKYSTRRGHGKNMTRRTDHLALPDLHVGKHPVDRSIQLHMKSLARGFDNLGELGRDLMVPALKSCFGGGPPT